MYNAIDQTPANKIKPRRIVSSLMCIVFAGAVALGGQMPVEANKKTEVRKIAEEQSIEDQGQDTLPTAGAVQELTAILEKSDTEAERLIKIEKKQKKLEKIAREKAAKEARKLAEEQERIENTVIYYEIDNGTTEKELTREFQKYTWKMCKKYGIREYYENILAQMFLESKYNVYSVSPTNDYGLMQINIRTWPGVARELGFNDITNPYQNIEAGVYLMSKYLKKYNSLQTALVCYNMGEGAVINRGIYSSEYSRKVIALDPYLKETGREYDS